MDHSDDWLRRLNPPRRNHFFTGKMMGVAQFEREQRYGMGERWLLNRLTLGTGILCGLDVTVTGDGKFIRLEAGVAVDPWGREIVVARAVAQYDPFKAGGDCGCGVGPSISEAGDYLLCLTYRECTADEQPAVYADDCSGQPDCQPDAIVETFALGLRPAAAAPAGFNCGAWTAGVPPAADSPADATTKPPTAGELRERLLQQFGASCGQIPADPCVPLGRVTAAKNTDGTWTLSLGSKESRVQIYSQAQLLDLILCLTGKVAECCKDGTPTDPVTPTDTASLRVNDLVVGTLGSVGAVGEVESLQRLAGAGPPRFVLPSNGAVVIAVSFNHAADTRTLVPAVDAAAPRSVSMLMTDPAPGGTDVLIPVGALAVPLDPSVWLLFMASAGRTTGVRYGLFDSGAGGTGGRPASGVYTLTLSGTADAMTVTAGRRLAIASTAVSPATPLVLNGDYSGTFPSGDATPGGDFVYKFEFVQPLEPSMTVDGVVVDEKANGSWTWTANDMTVLLDFAEDIDQNTVAAGVEITITGTSMRVPPVVTVTGSRQVRAVIAVTQPADFTQPNFITVKLPKSVLRAVDGRAIDRDISFQIDITQ